MGRLEHKIALITGAASGQGRAAAIMFAAEGARVMACDVNESGGQETVEMIASAGGDAAFQTADVASAAQVEAMVAATCTTFGGLDILYNNAAVWSGGNVDNVVTELDESGWDQILGVNLKGVYLGCKFGIPALIKRGGGSVINTASVAGLVGSRNATHAYSASKGGVISLTRAMAAAYAKQKIRANVICPGGVDTPMIAPMLTNERRIERFATSHPIGRIGTPDDVAYCALYLASDESSWVTGAVFPIDGGFTSQ